jgi:hypothetical protein
MTEEAHFYWEVGLIEEAFHSSLKGRNKFLPVPMSVFAGSNSSGGLVIFPLALLGN